MPPVEVGETFTETRTFQPEDVDQFAALSGDDQPRHTEPDGDGRRMVQGLLTASLLTSIGGDLEVLASRMDLQFQRPVYTGETLVCELTIVSADPDTDDGVPLVGDVTVQRVSCGDDPGQADTAAAKQADGDTAGTVVLEATVEGLIRE
ncbi:MaoC/PaaZ C-terminal domain-containing protein [Haloarcula argentinensis]|uniref:Enoyl-CoA hydratase n=1 Tax=Haloarcula argentinensis TaxID=43776 RepID=A0ABU2F4V6_HALAR|nr:MaoC/PaaZ C-terminal domain-containing protein [Haloarcula argentinensis]EMA21055.1 (R)-specific enoyl -CoA hydratase [Haloarcula argentinensis DSM 12282]MDS0255141.1 enoyl-CoA hydratase [Haloarcula argentinensis]